MFGTPAAREVAQMRNQALVEEQWRRTILHALDVQGNERRRWGATQRLVMRAVVVATVVWIVGCAIIVGNLTLTNVQSGHFSLAPLRDDIPLIQFPIFLWPGLLFTALPRRALLACVDTLARIAASGDVQLVPRAAVQPVARATTERATNGEVIGPLLRWQSAASIQARRGAALVAQWTGGCVLVMSAICLAVAVAAFQTSLFGSGFFLLTGAALACVGVWACVTGWRVRREGEWMLRPLHVTATTDGLAWADPAWRTRREMRLAWRDVRSFSVVTYRRTGLVPEWQAYLLDDGQTRLLWALPPEPPGDHLAAHERLAGLIVSATGLPLRELTPGVVALGAAIGGARPFQTKMNKAFIATQPSVPDLPLPALRHWYRRYFGFYVIVLALDLLLVILTVIAQFVH